MQATAVNLPRTYPTVVESALNKPAAQDEQLKLLAQVTLGDWARVSTSDATGTQLVLGAYLGVIVTAYTITGYTRGDDDRIRWSGYPADDYARLIGQTLPGGDWKRGQARPLRKVRVEKAPGSAEAAMLKELKTMLRYNHDPQRRELCKELEAQISVRVQTPTTVRIRVPVGMRILIDPI